jgi:pyridoxamine 5'-phosphate oxidase family protein
MSVFTDAEVAYLESQRLARLATIGRQGHPHVVPVAFRYNASEDAIDIGGHGFARSKKYRDAQRDGRVAVVVDDVPSVNPWRARGIEVRGEAEVLPAGGQTIMSGFDPEMVRVRPRRIVAWGIEGEPFQANARSVSAAPDGSAT